LTISEYDACVSVHQEENPPPGNNVIVATGRKGKASRRDTVT